MAELEPLEPEFIQFLIVQGIPADWWENWKKSDPTKVEQLIADFSQVIWHDLLPKIKYLELRTAQDVKAFFCAEDYFDLIGARIVGSTTVQFSDFEDFATTIDQLVAAGAHLQLYGTTQAYENEDRNQELYQLLEAGAKIGKTGVLYHALKDLKSIAAPKPPVDKP